MLLWKLCLLNISMETSTKSTVKLFDITNPKLQNTIFQHSHHHQPCIFFFCQQWTRDCMPCLYKSTRLSRTYLAFHITVATAEIQHPLPHCFYMHCLVSVSFLQALMNVSVYNFFHLFGGIQFYNLASHTHTQNDTILSECFCCHQSHGNKTKQNTGRKFSLIFYPINICLWCHGPT